MGVSVLVPADLTTLTISASWGDYRPVDDDKGVFTGKWQRQQREKAETVRLNGEKAAPPRFDASADGLEVVVTVRRIRRPGTSAACRPTRVRSRSSWSIGASPSTARGT